MSLISVIVNIGIIVLLAIIPTLLGESLNNPIHIIYLVSIIILSAIIQSFIAIYEKNREKINNLNEENSNLEKRYNSSILGLKAKGVNYFDVAILPLFFTSPKINHKYHIRIYVNSKDKLEKPPELTFTSEKNIVVKKTNIKIENYLHNDLYFFLLSQTLERNEEDIYYYYEFDIEFKEQGENNFKLLVESKDLSSEIKNSFFVQ